MERAGRCWSLSRIAPNDQCRGRAMFPAACQSRQWGIRGPRPLRDRHLAPSRAGSLSARDVAAETVILAIQLKNEVLSHECTARFMLCNIAWYAIYRLFNP